MKSNEVSMFVCDPEILAKFVELLLLENTQNFLNRNRKQKQTPNHTVSHTKLRLGSKVYEEKKKFIKCFGLRFSNRKSERNTTEKKKQLHGQILLAFANC